MNKRVFLRAFEPEDYRTSTAWRNDDESWSKLVGLKYFVSESYEKKWVEDAIKDNTCIRLAICLTEDRRYIGNVGITKINLTNRSGVSSIFIGDRSCWGKGLGVEAYRQLLEYAFNERGFHRIEARVLEGNLPSLRMHQKCGFKVEGTLRDSVFKNGRWQNLILLSILEDDFRSL